MKPIEVSLMPDGTIELGYRIIESFTIKKKK